MKIRGFRVEPGEVESVLARAAGVGQAVVVAREDRPGDVRLTGYVVADAGEVEPAALREWCAGRLPHYMVPSDFVYLDALPVTVGGKLDRAALPAALPGRTATGVDFAAPRDETERLIAGIWGDVLGVEDVGIDDGFFDLGGHSLLATMAVSRVAERFGREIELRTIFENPRIRDFGALVSSARAATTSGVVPVSRTGQLPASFAQERLWFLDRMSDHGDDYVLALVWRVRGGLDRDAWQGALDDMAARHEVLRTALVEVDGRPVQRVVARVTVPLEWSEPSLPEPDRVDSDAERLERTRELAARFAARRFDLGAAPLVRAGVWELGARDCVAVVAFHHVAFDGWSKRIFVAELTRFYQGRLSGTPARLPELPVQYADYAVWQRDWVSGGVLDRQLDYWRATLSGLPALDLPTDLIRPGVSSGRGGSVEIRLPGGLLEELEGLGRRGGATLFMVLLAAFQVVLGRWSGQRDVAVGTPVAGRGRVEVEELIGFFVNTLVLRGDLSGDPTFEEYLGRVRESVLGAFGHQDVPFERLVEELRPERDPSRTPLFQVMFDVQDRAAPLPVDAALDFDPFELPWEAVKFDLSPSFRIHDGDFRLEIEYSRDLFDVASVERLAGHVRRVLESVVRDPGTGVWELGILSEPERAGLLESAGPGRDLLAEYAAEPGVRAGLLPGLLRERAAAASDDVAVVCEDRSLTYRDVDRMADGLAGALAARGVAPGGAVGVCLGRGEWSVVAMVAVWRAGGVYVPMDPRFPGERLEFMTAEAGVVCVVTDRAHQAVADALGVPNVVVDAAGPAGDPAAPAAPDVAPPGEHDLAYVIFTSGSTGRPKAVGVAHGPLARHVLAARELFELSAGDRVMAFASFSFDASLEQVLPALTVGAQVVVRPELLWSVAELAACVRDRGVTVMELTPAYWEELAADLGDVAGELRSLRLVVTGGEELPSGRLERWFTALPGVPIVNTYGPTESVISATAYTVTGPLSGRVPIGRPLGGRRAYVVDPLGELVPVGVPGELLLGGAESAVGYLGRPELTAERFVSDRFGGGRLYRTGDRVRLLPGGDLEFLGRVDDQVKIRGFRIEPAEVEAVIGRFPGVRGAAVTVRGEGAERMLVGYAAGSGLDTEALGVWCGQFLPDYMVPPVFVVLDALPLTVQGKVDTAALPVPDLSAVAGFVPPRTPTEEVVAQIWAEVLGVDEVGARDNFFTLGGHSIRAVTAASRLRTVFDCPVQVRTVFEHPTVERLSAEIERLLVEQIAAMSEEEIDLSLSADPRS